MSSRLEPTFLTPLGKEKVGKLAKRHLPRVIKKSFGGTGESRVDGEKPC